MGNFADGLKDFFTRGALVKPVSLNSNIRNLIKELIDDSLENTSVMFEDDDEESYDDFMKAMMYMQNLIETGSKIRRNKIPKQTARRIYFWINSNKNSHLADEEHFDDACQWLINIISKQYSIGELMNDN